MIGSAFAPPPAVLKSLAPSLVLSLVNGSSAGLVVDGLSNESGIGLTDPSSGVHFGFTVATGANKVNLDIDQISIYGGLN